MRRTLFALQRLLLWWHRVCLFLVVAPLLVCNLSVSVKFTLLVSSLMSRDTVWSSSSNHFGIRRLVLRCSELMAGMLVDPSSMILVEDDQRLDSLLSFPSMWLSVFSWWMEASCETRYRRLDNVLPILHMRPCDSSDTCFWSRGTVGPKTHF
jgi:hypothetical protein